MLERVNNNLYLIIIDTLVFYTIAIVIIFGYCARRIYDFEFNKDNRS